MCVVCLVSMEASREQLIPINWSYRKLGAACHVGFRNGPWVIRRSALTMEPLSLAPKRQSSKISVELLIVC